MSRGIQQGGRDVVTPASAPASDSVALEAQPRGGRGLLAIGLVVLSLVSQELGAATAVFLFPLVGALGSVTLRLVFSAAVLLLVFRPRLRGRSRGDWLTVIVFGVSVWLMNTVFYWSLERVSLGVAVTLEMLGPLLLTVIVSRRRVTWLWVGVALLGVVLLGLGAPVRLDLLGAVLAVLAGGFWATYIALSARTGKRFARLDGLGLAMGIAALLSLGPALAAAGPLLSGVGYAAGHEVAGHADVAVFLAGMGPYAWLLLGFAVALLSSAIPYGLDMLALRRVRTSLYAVLMSLLPAVAAAIGFLVLGQPLGPLQLAGIALVILASAGAVRARV